MLLNKMPSLSKATTFYKLILLTSLFWGSYFVSIGQVWINEIHYDNAGADQNECVEIAGVAGTDLTQYSIVLYNGSNGTTYQTINFSGVIPDEGCGYGASSECPSFSIQNGAPDGMALVGPSGVVQFLSYEGSFTATNGPANGTTSTDIGVSESSSTPVGHSLQLTGSGTSYTDFAWQNPSTASMGSLNTGQTITPCGSVTISTGTLSTAPFNVTCTAGSNGTLAFTSTGTFNSGNTFTAQLSDASGSFGTPTGIGTFSGTSTGTDPSGTINIAIPQATPSGTNYKIRIVSSNPAGISNATADFEVILTGAPCTLEPPHLTSVLINSCTGSGSCQEGNNELVFGNTGDYSVNVTASNFNFHYGSNPTASSNTNYTDVLVQNTTTTTAINTAAGCAGTYVEGEGATMPPNSAFILASSSLCIDALTWSGLCGQGPIYVIYQNDPDWNTSGNFVNSTTPPTDPNKMRYFHTSITTTSGQTFSIDYNFDRSQNTNSDGALVTFSSSGGAPTSYSDDDCVLNPIVLPIEVTEFSGEYSGVGTVLKWTSATEINSDYYLLEKSANGFDFEPLANIPAAGNSTSPIDYHYFDRDVFNGVYYYRLIGFDYDGTKTNHGIVAVHVKSSKIIFNQDKQIINIGDGKGISVYALDGKLIVNAENESRISFTKKGFYVVLNQETGETLKIINP